MTQQTNKGAASQAAARNKKARRAQRGQGRLSKSLGADDPRHRRNAQNSQTVDKTIGAGLTYDRQGRLTTEGA
jgi:hypothetical protein